MTTSVSRHSDAYSFETSEISRKRKGSDLSGPASKKIKLLPISIEDAVEQIKTEMKDLYAGYKNKLNLGQKFKTNLYLKIIDGRLDHSKTKEKVIDVLTDISEKIEELKEGKSEEDTKVADKTLAKIKKLAARLKV